MSTYHSKKVLLIDDEQIILDELEHFLTQQGFETETCQSADDALQRVSDEDYDLIISDINLGLASGLELCQQIHHLEKSSETPVIFLSGAQIPDIIRKSHSAGGTYYVRKPFDPEVMIELIDKAMWLPALAQHHLKESKPLASV